MLYILNYLFKNTKQTNKLYKYIGKKSIYYYKYSYIIESVYIGIDALKWILSDKLIFNSEI